MQRALTLYQTNIGKKAVLALTGFVLVGFVTGHMLGNMNAYLGEEALNGYAETLRSVPALLWTARIALLIAFPLHIYTAISLVRANRAARPQRYAKKEELVTSVAAKWMPYTGLLLLAFLLFHLAHLTFGWLPNFDPTNVYANFVSGFQNPVYSAFYIVGNLALGFHLFHGVWSMFQSLGASHPKYDGYRVDLAIFLSAIITIGNISFPIAVLAGVIQ
ncbi:MAG: succinate dehydrogenase cytochrome b subunit [Sandaracinaceae bacterium]|nr:succinate dehydrogenase cytochrome b subunit [Sandaracinaceae bacterium]